MGHIELGKGRTDRFGSKANFIRSQPESMSASEIVEAAAKQGIKVSVNHVYNLRALAKRRSWKGGGSRSATMSGTEHAQVESRLRAVERQLRMAIAQVGLRRAWEIYEAIEGAFRIG